MAVACAAGSESQRPLQPKTATAGRYARYATGPYVSPRSVRRSRSDRSVWIRVLARAVGVGGAAGPSGQPRCGMWPYGAPAVEDPVGTDHAGVADVDHQRGVCTSSPIRKPTRKSVAARSAHTGNTGAAGASGRDRSPIQHVRTAR